MESLINLLVNSPFFILKICILFVEVLYLGFAFVLFKQERLMSSTIEVPISQFFQFLTLTHFLGSIVVFIFSLLIL